MRPALKSYVYFERHPDGVLFRKGAETFVLRGPEIYPLVARMLDLLDGRHSLATIEASIPPKLAPLLAILVAELSTRSFLVDRGNMSPELGALHARHASTLNYLTDHVPDAALRFEQWHRCPIEIGGSGVVLEAAVEALVGLGAGEIRVHIGTASQSERLRALFLSGGTIQICVEVPIGDRTDSLYAADRLDTDDAANFFATTQVRMVAGTINGRVIQASGDEIAPSQLALRMHAPHEIIDPTRGQLALAGNLLAHEWFRRSTGIIATGRAFAGKLIEPQLSIRPLLGEKPDTRALAMGRPSSVFESFWESVKPLFDPVSGLFLENRDGGLIQVPLMHQEIELRMPGAARRRLVHGWGLGLEDASRRGLLLAIEAQVGGEPDLIVARAGFSAKEAEERLTSALRFIDARERDLPPTVEIDPQLLTGDVMVLWRLAQALAGRPFRMFGFDWKDAFAVTVSDASDGTVLAWGAEPSRDAAAIEALGSFCSMIQRGLELIRPARKSSIKLDIDPRLQAHGLHVAPTLERHRARIRT